MAEILLVEDSAEIRDAVYAVLGDHKVQWAETLSDARKRLSEKQMVGATPYDLVLLDIDLPDGNGIDFLATQRSLTDGDIGTILLTGINTVDSRTKGYGLGVLDYIAKPFDLAEFQVRVNAKLNQRKAVEAPPAKNILNLNGLEIDLTKQMVFNAQDAQAKTQIDLTPVEFKLLLLFTQNANDVVARKQILDTVWGQTAHVSARCVDHHVCGLRKKISTAPVRIESIYGVGYRIEAR